MVKSICLKIIQSLKQKSHKIYQYNNTIDKRSRFHIKVDGNQWWITFYLNMLNSYSKSNISNTKMQDFYIITTLAVLFK